MATTPAELVATQRSYVELMLRPDYRRLVAKYSIVPQSDDRSGSETIMRNSVAAILVIVACMSRYRAMVAMSVKLANDGTWEWVGDFLDVGGERIGVVKIPAPVVVVEDNTVDVQFHDDYSAGEYFVILPLAIASIWGA